MLRNLTTGGVNMLRNIQFRRRVLPLHGKTLDSYNGWRKGLPPQFYPTHSNAFHICVTGGTFTEASWIGMPIIIEHLKPGNNIYQNPYGTEIALFRNREGGTARMAVSWDTPDDSGETGYDERADLVNIH